MVHGSDHTGAAFTGGARSPLLAWLLIPAALLAARFRPAVVAAGMVIAGVAAATAAAVATLTKVTVRTYPAGVWLAVFAALVVNVAAVTFVLLRAELLSRSDAVVDPLTGLLNRKALTARLSDLEAHVSVARRGTVSVLVCDIDRFKQINDQRGHDRGDAVLAGLGRLMIDTLRPYELVYRLGGDEFVVVLPDVDLEAAQLIAERLRRAVEQHPLAHTPVTLSIGTASTASQSFHHVELLRRADQALYAAKQHGRNQIATAADLATAGPFR